MVYQDMGGYALRKVDRVRRRQDYVAAYKSGKRIATQHFIIIVRPNNLGIPRMGIAISRKIKGAVRRNRVKRLIREFFRLHKSCLLPSNDYIFSVRRPPSRLAYPDIEHELKKLPLLRTC